MEYPLVSIVIPVYNGSDYLSKAIESSLNQTYKNIEIIVINDGSKDNGATEQIALSYCNKIRYFAKEENGGVSSALNLGIREMKGEYFSWLSHDDEYCPDKIQKQIEYINKFNCKDCIIFTDYELIDEKSNTIGFSRYYNVKQPTIEALSFGIINACTLLVPSECFDSVGRFDINSPTTQDYEICLRLLSKFKFIHLPCVLVRNRRHKSQTSKTIEEHYDEANFFYIRLLERLNETCGFFLSNRSFLLKMAAFLKRKNYSSALNFLYNKYLPLNIIKKIKIFYYAYIYTKWSCCIGMSTIFVDPYNLYLKLKSKFIYDK